MVSEDRLALSQGILPILVRHLMLKSLHFKLWWDAHSQLRGCGVTGVNVSQRLVTSRPESEETKQQTHKQVWLSVRAGNPPLQRCTWTHRQREPADLISKKKLKVMDRKDQDVPFYHFNLVCMAKSWSYIGDDVMTVGAESSVKHFRLLNSILLRTLSSGLISFCLFYQLIQGLFQIWDTQWFKLNSTVNKSNDYLLPPLFTALNFVSEAEIKPQTAAVKLSETQRELLYRELPHLPFHQWDDAALCWTGRIQQSALFQKGGGYT